MLGSLLAVSANTWEPTKASAVDCTDSTGVSRRQPFTAPTVIPAMT